MEPGGVVNSQSAEHAARRTRGTQEGHQRGARPKRKTPSARPYQARDASAVAATKQQVLFETVILWQHGGARTRRSLHAREACAKPLIPQPPLYFQIPQACLSSVHVWIGSKLVVNCHPLKLGGGELPPSTARWGAPSPRAVAVGRLAPLSL